MVAVKNVSEQALLGEKTKARFYQASEEIKSWDLNDVGVSQFCEMLSAHCEKFLSTFPRHTRLERAVALVAETEMEKFVDFMFSLDATQGYRFAFDEIKHWGASLVSRDLDIDGQIPVEIPFEQLKDLGILEQRNGQWAIVKNLNIYLPAVPELGLPEFHRTIAVDMGEQEISIYMGSIDLVSYKGGIARAIFKMWDILAGVCSGAYQTQEGRKWLEGECDRLLAEFPPSDRDAVVGIEDQTTIAKIAKVMGVEPVDLEVNPGLWSDETGVAEFLAGRDLTNNKVILDLHRQVLIFGADAMIPCLVGNIIRNMEGVDLFGPYSYRFSDSDKIYVAGKAMARMISQLIGTLELILNSEGWVTLAHIAKAKRIILQEKEVVGQLGLSWLVLVRKFMKKPNAAECVAQLFSIASLLEQTNFEFDGEVVIAKDPLEWINCLLQTYPFFNFRSQQTNQDLVCWVIEKVFKAIRRNIIAEFNLYPDERPIDSVPGIRVIEVDAKAVLGFMLTSRAEELESRLSELAGKK